MESSAEKKTPPPYFAFKTLTNQIGRMEETGPPTRIDRTFLPSMSNQAQTQFIAGMKSLGLIDQEGNVQPRLEELVVHPDERPRLIGEMVRDRYAEALALGDKATTGQLLEVFKNYGVQGDTARKAIAFFIQAARYGEVPISPYFRTPQINARLASNGSASPARRGPGRPPKRPPDEAPETVGNLPPALAGLLTEVPSAWTKDRRDAFLAAFTAILDYSIPVVERDEIATEEGNSEGLPW